MSRLQVGRSEAMRMGFRVAALAAVLLLPGCTSVRLKRSTVDQAATLTELQYQQVLDNVAMFRVLPDALPHHVNLRDGSAQVADVGSASLLGDWHRAFVTHPGLLRSRTVVEQWGMSPVTDDTELKLLQMAYRRAVGFGDSLENVPGEDGRHDYVNGLAHDLAKQMPDLDDYRGEVNKMYDQEKARSRQKAINDHRLPVLGFFLDPRAFFRVLLQPDAHDAFVASTISVIDEDMIYQEEDVANLNIYGMYNGIDVNGRLKFDKQKEKKNILALKANQPIEVPNALNDQERFPLPTQYGGRIKYVTPDAAEVRRQVKDIQNDLLKIGPGWYGVGGKRDVPRDACFVGRYRDCYVWVCRDGVGALSELTLKVNKIAGLIKDESLLTIPGPRFTPASGFPSL